MPIYCRPNLKCSVVFDSHVFWLQTQAVFGICIVFPDPDPWFWWPKIAHKQNWKLYYFWTGTERNLSYLTKFWVFAKGAHISERWVGNPGFGKTLSRIPGSKKQRIPDLRPCCANIGNHKILPTKNTKFHKHKKFFFVFNPTSRQTGHSSSLLAELIMSGSSVSLLLVRYPRTTTRKQYRRQLKNLWL